MTRDAELERLDHEVVRYEALARTHQLELHELHVAVWEKIQACARSQEAVLKARAAADAHRARLATVAAPMVLREGAA